MKTLMRLAILLLALAVATSAGAAEIHVFCSNGIRAVLEELLPKFEQSTGDKVILQYEPSSQLRKRIDAGEPFDLTILTTALIDAEIGAGRLAADSRTLLARSGLGVSIRAGAKKPNVSTVDAFKRALLDAESITYAQQGASAAPFEVMVAKLGLTAQLRPKYRLGNTAADVGDAVSSGRVELGIAPVSEILPVRGVDLVGPFPREIQSYVEMTGAVSVNAREKDAAKKLLAFIIAPGNLPMITMKGMER